MHDMLSTIWSSGWTPTAPLAYRVLWSRTNRGRCAPIGNVVQLILAARAAWALPQTMPQTMPQARSLASHPEQAQQQR
jgi:hypothetical protein